MIQFKANIRSASAASDDAITTGSVGIPVKLQLAQEFDGLAKTFCAKNGSAAVDIVLAGDATETVIPPDVLQTAGLLQIGVYAARADGEIVIPTVWASVEVVSTGVSPSGIDPSGPTPSWAAQVQQTAEDALQSAADASQAADNALQMAESVRDTTQAEFDALAGQVGAAENDIAWIADSQAKVPLSFQIVGSGLIRYDNGTVTTPSSVSSYTDYIDVSLFKFVQYKRQMNTASNISSGMAFYTADKTYISGLRTVAAASETAYFRDYYTRAVPENAKYARFTTFTDTETYGEFSILGIPPIGELSETVHQLYGIAGGEHQFPLDYRITVLKEGIQGSNGNGATQTNCFYTDYINVSLFRAVKYKKLVLQSGARYVGIACYDSNKAYLAGEYRTIGSTVGYEAGLRTFELPDNAVYVRVTGLMYVDGFEIYGAEPKNAVTDSVFTKENYEYRRNSVDIVNEFLTVARSFLNQTSIEYRDGQTIFYTNSATNGIDCSTFVILCLLGYAFSETPYSTGNYINYNSWVANPAHDWAINPTEYTIDYGGDNPDMVRRATQLAKWLVDRKQVVSLDNNMRDVRPGDLVFWGRKKANSSTGVLEWIWPNWFLHINHVGIITTRETPPDTFEVDGVTYNWDKSKYPYKHQYIDCGNTVPPVRESKYLEMGQEDPTNVEANNVNTIAIICRPDLGAI